jgi:hypothetical protein
MSNTSCPLVFVNGSRPGITCLVRSPFLSGEMPWNVDFRDTRWDFTAPGLEDSEVKRMVDMLNTGMVKNIKKRQSICKRMVARMLGK